MDYFNYRDGQLFAEDVPVQMIAEQYGTPCYIYSRATLERHWHAFNDALGDHPHLVCYAVKANSNIGLLNILARMGSGFDIVSGGELQRVLAAGGHADNVVFSGVGKSRDEMRLALEAGIHCFNVESAAELKRLEEVAAELGKPAPISLRVNPDVDANTHPYISTGLKENKFGIDIDSAYPLYLQANASPHLVVSGIDCHIGSQLTDVTPFLDALDRVLALVDRLAADAVSIDHIDLGGGLGVRYTDENPPEPQDYARAVKQRIGERDLEILIEPGRAIAANAGILVTRVEYLKSTSAKNFAVVDAAMNDLIRPSLYQAIQDIIKVDRNTPGIEGHYDLVGPICETGDFLGKNRELALSEGELLAVRSSGAYGFTMASNYNTRPRPAEVMVDGSQIYEIRRRETVEQLFENESLLPE